MTQPASSAPAVAQLITLLGADCVRTDAGEIAPLLVDHRGLYHGNAAALIQPRSVEQVALTLAYCNSQRIGVVPQGGNTGYCGGATPDASGSQIIVSLQPPEPGTQHRPAQLFHDLRGRLPARRKCNARRPMQSASSP